MSISLKKGHKVDLTKSHPDLTKVTIGLGWDPVKSGFFSSNIDCDASAVLLDETGKLTKNANLVYFGNKKSPCGSVVHSGDNLTGTGDGDDEQIHMDLKNVPNDVHRIAFIVNIYKCEERKQHFGNVKNAYIRAFDPGKMIGNELIRYDLTNDYSNMTAIVLGEIYRHNGEWKFSATGEGTVDTNIKQLVGRIYS
ncbi:TerD family protein [Paenibacillus terrae]|uniref:Stress protein n=1 Tax=Paenibacillus terrae TaxID=159743 RepID=A0A0D7WX73_9BACL|nr:TerD family protein [Paenibacillus terrae]KJD43781.1 stress protein [Paenibacillus terrae]